MNKNTVSIATLIKKDELIGVIGGTPVDSRLGVEFLRKKNVNAISANISDNPFDQTLLQLCPASLTNTVKHKINGLLAQGCTSIFIYCNSLSAAINLDSLRNYFDIPLYTPLETYSMVSRQLKSAGLIAANCQALSNIEKIILKANHRAIITGFSSLVIVDSIENGLSPQDIIIKYDLIAFIRILKNYNIDIILLGCTHFSYFYDELIQLLAKEKISMQLFDPSETMFGFLAEKKKLNFD